MCETILFMLVNLYKIDKFVLASVILLQKSMICFHAMFMDIGLPHLIIFLEGC